MSEENDKAADVTGAFTALTLGFNLNRRQQALLLRVGWVLLVTTHIAWACGALTFIGLVGFARSNEVQDLKQAVEASAKVTISQEIRAQARVRCKATDQAIVDSITRYIDNLQDAYQRIAGQRFPEPPCT